MDVLDNIKWCLRQISNALDTQAAIKAGARTVVNGVDITAQIGAKAAEIVVERTRLIAAYLRLL